MTSDEFIFEFPVYVIARPVGDGMVTYLSFSAQGELALCVFTEQALAESVLFGETLAGSIFVVADPNSLIELLLKRDRSITAVAIDPNFRTLTTRAFPVADVLDALSKFTGMS